ncbi:Lon protease C-terminal proteolytic domain-domain-containing protein [Naematelia encephala]|uniref:endopeptidase La n=1 Tax=Naematelia encephala TaxID=71784 RepID=A0A1Y2BIE9_9TREE|nr:Lon protease C-terminal proteolytic domain-domain-containing protein [Naematelia encephala]
MLGSRDLSPNSDRQVVLRPRKPSTSTALVRRTPPDAPSNPQIPEDLQPLQNLFERRRTELSSAAAQAVQRELGRLTKIPAQSAEYGVSKTYIEWILALPWLKVSETSKAINLDEARRRLEEGHEGLEAVKRRVVEYLAVYRLKRQLFEELSTSKRNLRENQDTPNSKGTIDASTAKDLLELIPADERKSIEEPVSDKREDGPPDDVYRDKGPILLLVGPPGVGKTSIARSLAESLGRKFHRISLGGVRDEAEIRGHRRTYVGALPGTLVQGLRKVGVSNPLILLDELDKVGTSNFHGDPSAALLETLDPAQNWSFHDHYLGDVPIDLSQCMFVATANTLDTISPPLLDRCEVIECPGYVTDEKLAIARRFLVKKQVEENGLRQGMIEIGDEALLRIITDYTREAGVRSLEREIGKICRTKAVEYSRSREQGAKAEYDSKVSPSDVETILGVAKYEQEVREEVHRPGVVTGLAYQGSGSGGILLLETTLIPGGKGRLVMTGSLGDVISESAELGLSWVKSKAVQLGITSRAGEDPLKDVDLHLHLPSGAVKKDGPSAGVAMVLAFVSLLTDRPMPSTTAVTGEITLRGAVTPVGGIKEKLLGASRAGITKVILPRRNRKDVQADLPESVRKSLEIIYVDQIEEVLQEVWGKEVWADGRDAVRVDARL